MRLLAHRCLAPQPDVATPLTPDKPWRAASAVAIALNVACVGGLLSASKPVFAQDAHDTQGIQDSPNVEDAQGNPNTEPSASPPELVLTPPKSKALALNQPVRAIFNDDRPAVFHIDVDEPGLLTLAAVGSMGDADIYLEVADDLGQTLVEGDIDFDSPYFDSGEHGTVALPAAGRYLVFLGCYDDRTMGQLTASFTPVEGIKTLPNPNGRADDALVLTADQTQTGLMDTYTGDAWDWVVFHPTQDGVIEIQTRTPDDSALDLFLDIFATDQLHIPSQTIDSDEEGHYGWESVQLAVTQGQPVIFRVSTYWEDDVQSETYDLTIRWVNDPHGSL